MQGGHGGFGWVGVCVYLNWEVTGYNGNMKWPDKRIFAVGNKLCCAWSEDMPFC